jgi:hypothetical protein
MWQNHVQQDYGKNPNGTGNDMVRDKVGHVPWNAQFRHCKRAASKSPRGATDSRRRAGGVRLAERSVLPKKPAISAIKSLPAIMSRRRLCEGGSGTTTSRGDGGAIAGRPRSARLIRGGPGGSLDRPRTNVRGLQSHEVAWGQRAPASRSIAARRAPPTLGHRPGWRPTAMLRSPIRPAELRVRLRLSLCSKTTP